MAARGAGGRPELFGGPFAGIHTPKPFALRRGFTKRISAPGSTPQSLLHCAGALQTESRRRDHASTSGALGFLNVVLLGLFLCIFLGVCLGSAWLVLRVTFVLDVFLYGLLGFAWLSGVF